MAVIIEINDVDKSTEIDWKSINLNRAMTNQVDTFSFEIVRANSSGYEPAINDKVELLEDSVLLFGGQIVAIEKTVEAMKEVVKVSCKDFSFDMDRRLVVQVYENMTVDDIIDDIQANFLPAGYTTTNVNCTVEIKYIAFNYELPTKCLQQLAQITNYDWYVDEAKNIYFFLKGSQTAPFELSDTNGKYIYDSLEVSDDIANIKNSIIVRGGKYQGNAYYEDIEADGDQTTFNYAYQYANTVLTVNSVVKTMGIDFIDDPTGFDALYNFNEKAVKFPVGTRPTAGQIVRLAGNPYIPVVTKLTDSVSAALYGEFEFKIVDKSIASKEAARDRARAEIAAWAASVKEGQFSTYSTGLKVGHKIRIQSTNRGIDNYYIISRIQSKMHTPTSMEHSCQLVTSQTYGMVEFLQALLIAKDKEIEIGQDEVLDSVLGLRDDITLTDDVTALAVMTGPYKWEPTGSSNSRWNFSVWG